MIAAAAILATSVFAADISAKVQLEGKLFNYDGTSEAMSMFMLDKPGSQNWNPIFNTSVNGDKAGAEFCVYTGNTTNAGMDVKKDGASVGSTSLNFGWNNGKMVAAKGFKIWMSPADGFKLIFGSNDFNLNQEHITWSKTDSGIGGDFGYSLSYNSNGIGIDLMLNPGWDNAAWMSKAKNGDPALMPMGFKFTYGADFGTINFLLKAADGADKDGKNKNFNDLKFGLGYANNFDGINIFANFLGYMQNDFNKIRVELYAEGNADALAWKVFPTVNYDLKAKKDNLAVGLVARLDYALDGFGAYLYVESANFLADPFAITIKPGVSGNLSGAGWDVALQLDIAKKTNISVPVSFNYGW